MNKVEELQELYKYLPKEVKEDIEMRVRDWLVSGGSVNAPYIEQQIRFAQNVKQLMKEKTNN